MQKIFTCEACDFKCLKLSKWNSHIETRRHKKQTNEIVETLCCKYCGLNYASKSSLWNHEQKCKCSYNCNSKCNVIEVSDEDDETETTMQNISSTITPELVIMLIQQNKEMQKMMMEQNKEQNKSMMETIMKSMLEIVKNVSHNTTNNTNSHNKAFNMNFFLNDTCKNAMNMSDFVRNLVITTNDFEQTGMLGYVEGICRIMENGLNKLELHERPIHCSDVKRETIYIRENDKWEKDDEQKTKLLGAIKEVGAKNIHMIPQWCKEHPGWSDSDSKENDRYLKYVFNSMCGGTDDEIRNNYKCIMRHISRVTMMDKTSINL
jgi:hypothetical protein